MPRIATKLLLSSTVVLCTTLTWATAAIGAEDVRYRFVHVETLLGACCGDGGADLVVDSDGGVLVAGHRGGLDLDRDGTVDIRTHGSPDPLLFKRYPDTDRSSTGEWVVDPGGPEQDSARGVAPDRSAGAYVVGSFSEQLVSGAQTIRSAGRTDGFLLRYDARGDILWARAIGGEGSDELFDVGADAAGNAYVVGTVMGDVDVDRDGTVDVTGRGTSSALVASFAPDGSLRWARASGGDSLERGHAVAVAPDGTLYVAGFYGQGALDLDADGNPDSAITEGELRSVPVTPAGDFDGYFARFQSNGESSWIRVVTGAQMQMIGSLDLAGNGDLLVLGAHTAPVDLDLDGESDLPFESLGARRWEHHADANTFLLRVTPDGETVWARRYAAAAAAHLAAGASRIVISGSYTGALDLDDDGLPERGADPDDYLEGFAAVLDDEGRLLDVLTVVGGDSDVVAAADFSADDRRLYATGYVKLGADFDGDGAPESNSQCHRLGDVYLALWELEESGVVPQQRQARR